MPKYIITGHVSASKHLGEFEANSPEDALKQCLEADSLWVSVCHQCSSDCEDPEIHEVSIWNPETNESVEIQL